MLSRAHLPISAFLQKTSCILRTLAELSVISGSSLSHHDNSARLHSIGKDQEHVLSCAFRDVHAYNAYSTARLRNDSCKMCCLWIPFGGGKFIQDLVFSNGDTLGNQWFWGSFVLENLGTPNVLSMFVFWVCSPLGATSSVAFPGTTPLWCHLVQMPRCGE